MKKYLHYFIACMMFVFYTSISFGQCTPDPLVTDPEGNGEMVPDTMEVWENEPVGITLTVIAPDTASLGALGHLNIDHITVKSLQNAPSWVAYQCNPTNCEFVGTESRCVWVSTTSVTSAPGFYPVDVLVDVYANLGLAGIVQVETNYNSGMPLIIWVHPAGWGVTERAYKGFGIREAKPNPFTNTVKIGCYTEAAQTVKLKVIDMVGNEVYNEQLYAGAGESYFQFNGSDLSNGIYFYSLIDEQNRVITKKFVKTK